MLYTSRLLQGLLCALVMACAGSGSSGVPEDPGALRELVAQKIGASSGSTSKLVKALVARPGTRERLGRQSFRLDRPGLGLSARIDRGRIVWAEFTPLAGAFPASLPAPAALTPRLTAGALAAAMDSVGGEAPMAEFGRVSWRYYFKRGSRRLQHELKRALPALRADASESRHGA